MMAQGILGRDGVLMIGSMGRTNLHDFILRGLLFLVVLTPWIFGVYDGIALCGKFALRFTSGPRQ
jgi:hypothetical protein